jgi:hypothetical protein
MDGAGTLRARSVPFDSHTYQRETAQETQNIAAVFPERRGPGHHNFADDKLDE